MTCQQSACEIVDLTHAAECIQRRAMTCGGHCPEFGQGAFRLPQNLQHRVAGFAVPIGNFHERIRGELPHHIAAETEALSRTRTNQCDDCDITAVHGGELDDADGARDCKEGYAVVAYGDEDTSPSAARC